MPETFVLVTGAWHGGWAWRPVAERLRAAGHRVHTPTLPGLYDGADPTSLHLADCGDAVADLIEGGDLSGVTLVGHSWGGYVITAAAHRVAPRLRKLVYWSAFVPAAGVPLYDEVPPAYRELFDAQAAASGNHTVTLPYEVWRNAFMNDAADEVAQLVHELTVPQPMQYFTETVEPLVPGSVPVAYVLSSDDVALPPGEFGWDRFPARLGVAPVPVPGGHEGCFTRPAELAEAILRA